MILGKGTLTRVTTTPFLRKTLSGAVVASVSTNGPPEVQVGSPKPQELTAKYGWLGPLTKVIVNATRVPGTIRIAGDGKLKIVGTDVRTAPGKVTVVVLLPTAGPL